MVAYAGDGVKEKQIPSPLFFSKVPPISFGLGAVHILRQPKSGVPGPPLPPLSAMVSILLTPPPPLVSFRQHLPDAPFVLLFFT